MRVVLLAYHYPPDPEVGGLRARKVADALAAAGHSVTVVHAAHPSGTGALDGQGPATVVPVTPARSLRDWYRELREAARSTNGAGRAAAEAGPAWKPPESVAWAKRVVYSLMWLPDDRQGFIWRAARAAIEALRRAGSGAVLYSTSPPASTQVAALLANLTTGARWVMELRDPWTDNPGKPWYCRTALTDRVERWLERLCLSRASRVVAVSDGIARLVTSKLGGIGDKLLVVRNGIDVLAEPRPARREGPRRVLHLGTCYLGRDPRPFLGALAAVARRRGLGPDDLQVELIGKCEWLGGISLRTAVGDLGLDPMVRFVPWLPHAAARERTGGADLLLLLAEGQPNQVPNKLYEYLGARRRMLVFADPEGETDRMVRAVGGHYITRSDDPDLEQKVEQALFEESPLPVGRDDLLREWGTEAQMGRLVEALTRLQPAT